MLRNTKWIILVFFLSITGTTFSQNYYNSPYTRYLIGDLVNDGFIYNRALGGSSVALRPHNQINYLNPASYTNQDTNSFLFQTGFTSRFATINTGLEKTNSNNMNIEYLAIGFPVLKWWNMSAGVTPYSQSQYFFREVIDDPGVGESITFDYNGSGGFNEFYFGNAFEIANVVSIGANISYMFGALDKFQSSYLTDKASYSALVRHKVSYITSDFYTKVGIQIHPVINKKHYLVAGVVIDAAADLDIKLKGNTSRHTPANDFLYNDSLHFNIDTLNPIHLPMKLAMGLTYNYNNMITVTGEYIRQDWSGTEITASDFYAGLYESYRFGVLVNPVSLDKRTRANYFQRITYSAGAFYTKTYLNNNGKNISEYGFSAGLALPWRSAKKLFTSTTFNIAYQYSLKGTIENGLIKENHHFLSVGVTLHDFWFLKPKYD